MSGNISIVKITHVVCNCIIVILYIPRHVVRVNKSYLILSYLSELPVCPDYTVYTSQAAEQDNNTHLTWPKTGCAYWL